MVSASGRPEDGTSLVPGFGCSGGVFGACGFVVCVRALGWFGRLSFLLCAGFWVWGRSGFPFGGWGFPWVVDLAREAVVDMII